MAQLSPPPLVSASRRLETIPPSYPPNPPQACRRGGGIEGEAKPLLCPAPTPLLRRKGWLEQEGV